MGMKTKISENAENIEKTADFIVNRFEERGWKAMGEKQNITLEKSESYCRNELLKKAPIHHNKGTSFSSCLCFKKKSFENVFFL